MFAACHAVAEKSRAEEYRRTAVQHCDTYQGETRYRTYGNFQEEDRGSFSAPTLG